MLFRLNMPKNDLDNDFFSLDMTNNQDGNNIPTSISNSNFYEQSLSKYDFFFNF